MFVDGTAAKVESPLKNVDELAVPEPNLAVGTVPDVKLLAFKLLKSIVCQVAALPEPPLDNT